MGKILLAEPRYLCDPRIAADEVDELTAANRALLEAAYLASAALVASAEGTL